MGNSDHDATHMRVEGDVWVNLKENQRGRQLHRREGQEYIRVLLGI